MTNLAPLTKYMVHLPLAFMPRPPKNGLVICFGMGTSFRSMLSWGIHTTAVDLIPSVPALFGYYHADASKLTSSPLARIVIDDGRRFLDGTNETYDVIIVDPPPPPEAAGSSLLYSREFYDVIKKHLSRDGVFQTWYPAAEGDTATKVSITKALMDSFPYVRAFSSFDHAGIHFLASMEPLPTTSSSVLASRLPPAAASDFLEWGPETNTQKQFDADLSQEESLEMIVAEDPGVPAMRDDRPINEYYLLRRWLNSSK
jgi:spermidine synthase